MSGLSRGPSVVVEGRTKLPAKVQDAVAAAAALAAAVPKTSQSPHLLSSAVKNFALQEAAIEHSDQNLLKLRASASSLHLHQDALRDTATHLADAQDLLAFLHNKAYFSKDQDAVKAAGPPKPAS